MKGSVLSSNTQVIPVYCEKEKAGFWLSVFQLSIVRLFLLLMNKGEFLGDRKVVTEKEFK